MEIHQRHTLTDDMRSLDRALHYRLSASRGKNEVALQWMVDAVLVLFKNSSWGGRQLWAAESRNVGMLCRVGTLLYPTVGLGSAAPLLQNFGFLVSKRRHHFRVGPLVQLIITAITK